MIGSKSWIEKLAPKEAKSHLGVLYIAKLAEPFFGLDFLDIDPKVDSPREIKTVSYFLIADVSEIWIFNSLTGEVYKKLKAGEKDPLTKPKILI